MFRKITRILPVVALMLFCVSCGKDPALGPEPDPTGVKLRILVNTPGARSAGTRVVAEAEVDEINVLVFEEVAGIYTYQYPVAGYSLSAVTGQSYDYEFLARLIPTPNPVRLYLVANGGGAVNGAVAGMSEAEVREAVTRTYTSAGFDPVLPMTGIVDLPQLNADITIEDAVLVRSVARVDVVSAAADFTLTSVKVYRATDMVQLIPDAMTGNVVSAASVPAGAVRNVDTGTFAVSGNSFTQQIYIPESDIPAVGDRRLTATAVVVGGVFAGSGETTYYRMDFDPDDDTAQALLGQVLRNHIYRFEIRQVLAPGWDTDDQASVNPSTGVEVEIKAWEPETMYMVFDDYNYFGVSTRSVITGPATGSQRTIDVDTNLGQFSAYWGNADGTYDPTGDSAGLGEEVDDPDGVFRAEISADGTVVTVSALGPYDASTDLPKYLILVAGRMRVVITVSQASSTSGERFVSIIGSTNEIGSWGNFQPGEGWNPQPGARAYGLGNMLMGTLQYGPQNFGPGLTYDMPGLYLAGVSIPNNAMPRNVYDKFDVLYLTYGNNPTAIQAADIIDWLDEDLNRVLVMQYDNAATNASVRTLLDLPFVAGAVSSPFRFTVADAPDFICTGPFGTITADFSYSSFDGTYGTITPANAAAQGFLPILTATSAAASGNYMLAVNPQRRIVICGECDIYGSTNTANGFFLNMTNSSPATLTIDPDNPAHVMMGNLFAWIFDQVLSGNS